MSSRSVSIELVKGSNNEYVVKDSSSIILGRFVVLELDSDNRKATLRLKFYKENNYKLLKETLDRLLKVIFNKKDILKVNIFVKETINVNAFLDMGFILEGIISNSIYSKGDYFSELVFGVNINDYNDNMKIIEFELEGENITLSNLSLEHAEELADYYKRNENHLKAFEPTRESSFYSSEIQREILIDNHKQFINGTSLDLGIFIDEKLIGKIKLSNIVYGVFKSGIIGYSIDEKYQGRGYMKEAVSLLCQYAFDEMGLHRIEGSVLLNNKKSQRVLEGCGFEKIGINKKYLFINGEWRDHITFYKLNEEI